MSRCSARVTSCVSRTEQRGEINTMKKPKFPKVSLILMIFFTVAGVIMMMMIPDLPRNIFGLDATTFIVGYLGYVYIILASLFYAKTGK